MAKLTTRASTSPPGKACSAPRRTWAPTVKFIETTDPKDYGKNIDQFAQDNYDVIITVGFALGDDTIAEAKKYPNIKFAGVDQFQGDTVTNLAGLIFDEDKAGYLAGYLAGSITKSGTIGQVLGTPIVPPVEKYGLGYINGAKAAKSSVKVLSACHPGGLAKGFTDPGWGNDTATQEMSQNADVIFAAGGQTGNGGLLAIASKGGTVLGIGVDTDQYLSLPEAKGILVSSAMKLITPGVFGIVKSVLDGSFKGGNVTGAVGLGAVSRPHVESTRRRPGEDDPGHHRCRRRHHQDGLGQAHGQLPTG